MATHVFLLCLMALSCCGHTAMQRKVRFEGAVLCQSMCVRAQLMSTLGRRLFLQLLVLEIWVGLVQAGGIGAEL
jgi:hypothetical protein